MSHSENFQYPGAPNADVFANSQAQGSVLVVDTTTDELWYYKEDSGARKIFSDGGWTYIKLASDFTISNTSPTPVTGMAFTPDPSSEYIVEGQLMLEGSSAGLGVCLGISWPSGLDRGVFRAVSSKTDADDWRLNNYYPTNANLAATSNPNANTPYPASLESTFLTGGSPSGNFALTLLRG